MQMQLGVTIVPHNTASYHVSFSLLSRHFIYSLLLPTYPHPPTYLYILPRPHTLTPTYPLIPTLALPPTQPPTHPLVGVSSAERDESTLRAGSEDGPEACMARLRLQERAVLQSNLKVPRAITEHSNQ